MKCSLGGELILNFINAQIDCSQLVLFMFHARAESHHKRNMATANCILLSVRTKFAVAIWG